MTAAQLGDLKIAVTFRHTEPTDALKTYATEKVTHCVQKYFANDPEVHVQVILCVEKRDHMAEVVVHGKNYDATGKSSTGDLYSAIDKVIDTIDAQLRKAKDKLKN